MRLVARRRTTIRDTIERTKQATFCVHLPNKAQHDFPTPRGTGFFIAPDGWFLTAAHVVTENGKSDGPVRKDVSNASLMRAGKPWLNPKGPPDLGESCIGVALEFVDPVTDVALLRVDKAKNSDREWLQKRSGFPYIDVSSRMLAEGEDVYTFGYPLSQGAIVFPGPGVIVGDINLSPRVTSAIVASLTEKTGMILESGPPLHYVLDKALNYGNSGGPIVATATGQAHAFCSRFQPVFVPQPHLSDPSGKPLGIMMPSLYGVVNLGHQRVRNELQKRHIPIA